MKDLSIKKLYYSISEVSKLTSVEQYILRYWETEFEQLRPQKNRAGNRIYTNKDINVILTIKFLLREKKYTIEGAKKILNENANSDLMNDIIDQEKESKSLEMKEETVPKENPTKSNLKKDLLEIKKLLEEIYSKL